MEEERFPYPKGFRDQYHPHRLYMVEAQREALIKRGVPVVMPAEMLLTELYVLTQVTGHQFAKAAERTVEKAILFHALHDLNHIINTRWN